MKKVYRIYEDYEEQESKLICSTWEIAQREVRRLNLERFEKVMEEVLDYRTDPRFILNFDLYVRTIGAGYVVTSGRGTTWKCEFKQARELTDDERWIIMENIFGYCHYFIEEVPFCDA